jgi:hypothetical protein
MLQIIKTLNILRYSPFNVYPSAALQINRASF